LVVTAVFLAFVPRAQDLLKSLWNGPDDLSRALRLEWRIVLGRWLAIVFVALGLALHGLPRAQTAAAFAVLAAAFAYTLVLQQLIRQHAPGVEDSTLPTLADGVLCAVMFPILGGFENPFYAVLYLVMISAGIRLGFVRAMLLACLIGAIDGFGEILAGDAFGAAYIVRTGTLVGTVLITSYLHEEASKTEAELAHRLLQSQKLNMALEYQALHDSLTDLPNRTMLHQRLEHALQKRDQGGSGSVALLVIDLDRFKEVNDTFGHQYGDILLQQIGVRLRDAVGPASTIARLGGDEFAVLLTNADIAHAQTVAQRLLTVLEDGFTIAEYAVDVGGSIGIALSPEHGADADVLLRRADVAMYLAKGASRGYAVYSFEQDQHSPERLALMSELRKAIENDELTLAYQPKVSLKSSRCVGVEALARWHHPQHGNIPPDRFIALAEQTGIMKSLSYWVLNTALKQAHEWQTAGLEVPIAVNLSMRDLHDPDLAETIAGLLNRWRVRPSNLQVEITENGLMADPARALQTLTGLRTLGLRIAIDDFGTGYSSLAYLKRLPVHELKIDRSFIRDLCADAVDRAIVRSTIGLGHDLGLSIVAEGVEDAASWELLNELGCDIGQGYYISRPIPAAELVSRFQPLLAAA
jgi:diguanylate cyclase (GGDEF)-like protein